MGVEENYVSSSRVLASCAWTVAGVLLVAGWVVIAVSPGQWGVGVMLAATAAAACAVAAVMEVRIYAARICTLIRKSHEATSAAVRNGGDSKVSAIH